VILLNQTGNIGKLTEVVRHSIFWAR